MQVVESKDPSIVITPIMSDGKVIDIDKSPVVAWALLQEDSDVLTPITPNGFSSGLYMVQIFVKQWIGFYTEDSIYFPYFGEKLMPPKYQKDGAVSKKRIIDRFQKAIDDRESAGL